MLTPAMQDALNDQIKNEFFSSYIYLSMAAWFDDRNLPGMAAWMRVQAREEAIHAMKIFDHLLDRNGRVKLRPISQPPVEFASPLDVFEQALKHEMAVTASIHNIYAQAVQEKDFASSVFLDWFVKEQVEEEKQGALIVEQLKMVGDDRPGLLMLDRELGQRQGGGEDGEADAT
ncbi:MAG TPA: ferritin [Gemmatimonadales bacterium]|nr:ferritin [Gemmatimonadales bacterium]